MMTPETRSDLRFLAVLAALVFCVCFGLWRTVPTRTWSAEPGPNGKCVDPHQDCVCVMGQGNLNLDCREDH